MKEIHGSGVALITCFNNDLSIDYDSMDKLLSYVTKEHCKKNHTYKMLEATLNKWYDQVLVLQEVKLLLLEK